MRNKKYKIVCIIGARPQFVKHYPFEIEAKKQVDLVTIHTGQHYDENMSQVFFDQLGMGKPNYMLHLGGGNHGEQTGKMMIEVEQIVTKEKPDALVVYGDTNSTLAGALVAAKLHIPLVHVEAGLRSYNKEMPEEVNRVLTDHVADLLFVPSKKSVENLKKEGITEGVHIAGDLMKDLILLSVNEDAVGEKSIDTPYHYVTLHRPYNVDQEDRLKYVLDSLSQLNTKVVFAIHPRTKNRMKDFGLESERYTNIHFIDPQPYFDNLTYLYHSDGLITDSGGMQKEAYWLKKPCVTIRTETEWVETLDQGANVLLFDDLTQLSQTIDRKDIVYSNDLYGDGYAAKMMIDLIVSYVEQRG